MGRVRTGIATAMRVGSLIVFVAVLVLWGVSYTVYQHVSYARPGGIGFLASSFRGEMTVQRRSNWEDELGLRWRRQRFTGPGLWMVYRHDVPAARHRTILG